VNDGATAILAAARADKVVNSRTRLKIDLAKGGGAAVSIRPANPGDLKTLKDISRRLKCRLDLKSTDISGNAGTSSI